ncbi:hypothetical protein LSAJ18_20046 [Latilactobacillus sakei]|nr:hypothetical protein LSAJ18_20046 [Latilactobacillus sakei]
MFNPSRERCDMMNNIALPWGLAYYTYTSYLNLNLKESQ